MSIKFPDLELEWNLYLGFFEITVELVSWFFFEITHYEGVKKSAVLGE
jgi:hypothetical protein